jgi:hypothetical protein
MTDTQVTVKSLTRRAEGADHILHIENFFSSPDLFDSLHKNYQLLWSCQTNNKCRLGCDSKKLKLKWSDIYANLTAMI